MKLQKIVATIIVFSSYAFADSLPEPKDVELGSLVRSASFVSELGTIQMRWPREVEKCFGYAPNRAMAEALKLTRRVLLRFPFPSEVKNSQASWNLVFTDEASAKAQFPDSIVSGRHPGFMVPPNNIYMISDFISPDCEGRQDALKADKLLLRILTHEIGHVVEFVMIGEEFGGERARAEGFASWFELEAQRGISDADGDAIESDFLKNAKEEFNKGGGFNPTKFRPTFGAYALWAIYFEALVEKKGFSALARAYAKVRETHEPLFNVVKEMTGFDEDDAKKFMIERKIS